jgi:signal transduction histidine kinase
MKNVNELILKGKREFINSICLIGVIPFLVFIYVLVSGISTVKMFFGETGYIMAATVAVFLCGVAIGRRMLWAFIREVLDYNKKIVQMQQELIDKNRLAAITETVLSLGHEINNPLLAIRGNLVMMENDFTQITIPDELRNRLEIIKSHFDRIGQATDKMSKLSKPFSEPIVDKVNMINLGKSE